MKIVQINTVCQRGSIPAIMMNLYRHAESLGHTCYIAYGRGKAPRDILSYKIGTLPDFFFHVLRNFFMGQSGFGSRRRTKKLLKWLDAIKPDVLHLHNLHGFYLQVELLFEYIKKNHIKTVWTLHDCWSFTGQCAYFDHAECEKWKVACHDCPIYRSSYPYSLFKDNSRDNYARKKAAFCGADDLVLVTPSFWLADLVGRSYLKDYPVQTIHNCIDPKVFHHLLESREELRKQLSAYPIDLTKKILLGVANVWDHRKGLQFFPELSDLLGPDYLIILVGLSKKQIKEFKKCKTGCFLPLSRTETAEELCRLYNLADVFVNPTLEDNFPTTNIEAMACGTPVITFCTGGSGECVSGASGTVLKEKTAAALAAAVSELLADPKADPAEIASHVPSVDSFCQSYMRLYQ